MRISRTLVLRAGALLVLVGIEVLLARSMSSTPSIKGYIETFSFSVSSAQKGIVRRIHVRLGEHVASGQIVAELESGAIDSEIATATVERQKLIAAARAGNPDESALQAIDQKLEHLAEKRAAIDLRSPVDGTIESINAHPGDPVNADAPIATIVTADTRHVVACVPEHRIGEVAVGSTADVAPATGGEHLRGVVQSLTPAIAELPARCQPVVAKPPLFGRIAMIVLDHPASSIPGETKLIAFGPQVPQQPALGSAVDAPSPQPITVPVALSAVTRIEASGLVWMASLDRYVVVSDETGSKGRHSPWLFSMSRRGVLDPDPITVSNVAELDDIEAIAADEHDGLWVVASQSKSDKGNRPPARELLAHLVPEGIGYRADKQVRLAPLLAGTQIDLEKLDIEGMAFHKGTLYLGLKSPTIDGKATMLQIAAPDRLLEGDAAGAKISVYGRVALPVNADGKQVPGGIADMMFLSDSALVIAATAPGASQQDGELFLVHVNDFSAVPLQTFPDLRPEGVALAPGGSIAVVFDRGRDVPLWTEVELPHSDL